MKHEWRVRVVSTGKVKLLDFPTYEEAKKAYDNCLFFKMKAYIQYTGNDPKLASLC